MAMSLAFLSILAAAIFPAVHSATESARATAMKHKARGIWVAVVSTNTEREILDLPLLWPGDLAKAGIAFENAEEYFTYLMSDGENKKVITRDLELRVVPDLKPEMLTGPGMTPAKVGGAVLPENNAWHVVMVDDSMPSEIPFLILRNAKASDIVYPKNAEQRNELIPLTNKPLSRAVVWLTRGGSVLDARKTLFNLSRLIPVEKPGNAPELKILPAQGGFQ